MLFFQVCVSSNFCVHCSVCYRSLIHVNPNNDCGMRGILMSIFTDLIAFKVVFLNVTERIHSLGSIQ